MFQLAVLAAMIIGGLIIGFYGDITVNHSLMFFGIALFSAGVLLGIIVHMPPAGSNQDDTE